VRSCGCYNGKRRKHLKSGIAMRNGCRCLAAILYKPFGKQLIYHSNWKRGGVVTTVTIPERRKMETQDRFLETEPAHRVRHTKVGDTFRATYDYEGTGGHMHDEENWKVIAVYPFHVLAKAKDRIRSFNFGTLVQMGMEDGLRKWREER